MRTVRPLPKANILKIVYFAYFHLVMFYGVIFWEIQQTAKEYLPSKNKIIRIMGGLKKSVFQRTV
jgi:hypothetical protein